MALKLSLQRLPNKYLVDSVISASRASPADPLVASCSWIETGTFLKLQKKKDDFSLLEAQSQTE